jgi:hypothetical protein
MRQTHPSIADLLARAHKRLRKDLRELEEATQGPWPGGPKGMGKLLADARADLVEHFRFEEHNGYMEAVLRIRPNLERDVQALLGQHKQLADALDQLIADVKTMTAEDGSFGQRVRGWIKAVWRHEARENTLVEDAFNVDLSAED